MRLNALFLRVLMLCCGPAAWAHPGLGIVQDSKGNVYFTDTRQVWQIAPAGTVSVVVPNVHTHELLLEANDSLLGEHLWYEGDTDKWGHRVWRRQADGAIIDVVPAQAGFRTEFFTKDRQGNMYWADRAAKTTLKKRTPDDVITTFADGPIRSVEKMVAMADGTLYLMYAGDLKRVSTQGLVSTVVRSLTGANATPNQVARMNYHMGLWTDANGRIYVAAAAERSVLRVDSKGGVSVVCRTAPPWSPSGGMIDSDGNLWTLEYDGQNRVRVRRTDRQGAVRVFSGTR